MKRLAIIIEIFPASSSEGAEVSHDLVVPLTETPRRHRKLWLKISLRSPEGKFIDCMLSAVLINSSNVSDEFTFEIPEDLDRESTF